MLTQIVQLDDEDIESLRELVRVYEALGRWRDLLAAPVELLPASCPKARRKASSSARSRERWLEQFSNVQNATDAYESLLAAAPGDEEAISKLKELYAKRRAWAPLYALFEKQAEAASGKARIDLLGEMAKLAAERLDRGADAIKIYKADPRRRSGTRRRARSRWSEQADRDKDFATVAWSLERRLAIADDDQARLAVAAEAGRRLRRSARPTMRAPPRRGGACSRSSPGTPRRCACCATRTSPAAISTASKSSTPRRTTGRGWPRCSPPAADRATEPGREGRSLVPHGARPHRQARRHRARVPIVRARSLGASRRRHAPPRPSSRSTRRKRSGRGFPRSTRSCSPRQRTTTRSSSSCTASST